MRKTRLLAGAVALAVLAVPAAKPNGGSLDVAITAFKADGNGVQLTGNARWSF